MKNKKDIIILSIIILALVLSITGIFPGKYNVPGYKKIIASDELYLNELKSECEKSFLLLTGLKTGLSIIEGSTIGFSLGTTVSLQAGDIVQGLLDLVNISWKLMFAGVIVSYILLLLLQGSLTTSTWFFISTSFLFSLNIIYKMKMKKENKILKRLSIFSMLIFLSLYLILPISFLLTSNLSEKISDKIRVKETKNISTVVDKIDFDTNELIKEPKKVIDRLKTLPGFLSKNMESMTRSIINLLASYFVDTILFPFLFIYLVYIIGKKILLTIL